MSHEHHSGNPLILVHFCLARAPGDTLSSDREVSSCACRECSAMRGLAVVWQQWWANARPLTKFLVNLLAGFLEPFLSLRDRLF